MKIKENVVFLGMMGSGKSSIGLLFSKRFDLEFFDIDKIIENKMNMTILKIFEIKGENFFRKLEEKTTLEILKKKNIVISLGGGGFLNKHIRKEIINNHISFWLNWRNRTLIERIKNSSKRPIAIKSSEIELLKLIKKRSHIYSKAMYKIDCENHTKKELVNKLIKIYETKKTNN